MTKTIIWLAFTVAVWSGSCWFAYSIGWYDGGAAAYKRITEDLRK